LAEDDGNMHRHLVDLTGFAVVVTVLHGPRSASQASSDVSAGFTFNGCANVVAFFL
jgi:hypothetical protein